MDMASLPGRSNTVPQTQLVQWLIDLPSRHAVIETDIFCICCPSDTICGKHGLKCYIDPDWAVHLLLSVEEDLSSGH